MKKKKMRGGYKSSGERRSNTGFGGET